MTKVDRFPVEQVFPGLQTSAPWPGDWFDFRSEDMQEFMTRFGQAAGFPVVRQKIGKSVEGRTLETHRFGRGRRRVLIWARQHGDEPECTAALCLALHELATKPDLPAYKAILGSLDILVFPTVNPDGMDRCTRQNAVGIDLNREATHLAMPEAVALVKLKDEFAPQFSFNLHDMNPRKAREDRTDAGHIGVAYQAGPFDDTNADNDVRLRAKTVIARLYEDMQKVMPKEAVCVYKAFYMSRAFGDSMMRWGVPCVLIESGSWYAEKGGEEFVIRVHALSILAGLYYTAIGADEPFDGAAYDRIPFDIAMQDFDGLIRGTRMVDPASQRLYRSDIGWLCELQDYRTDENRQYTSYIRNLGDISEENGALQWQSDDGVLVPGLIGVVPELLINNEIPTADRVMPYLKAGFTTLACTAGPFKNEAEREEFVAKAYRTTPPIHLAPFELVENVAAIRDAFAQSPLHGLASSAATIEGTKLIEVLEASGLGGFGGSGSHAGKVAVSAFFVGGSSRGKTRLHLVLSPAPKEGPEFSVNDHAALRFLGTLLVRSAGQITLSRRAGDPIVPALARLASPVAFDAKVPPTPGFLGHLAAQSSGAEAFPALVASCTNAMAEGLALARRGALRTRHLADIVLLPETILDPARAAVVEPRMVILNGRPVVDGVPNRAQKPRGIWSLAN